jgi:hypothetical protein
MRSYSLKRIADEAPAIAEVDAEIIGGYTAPKTTYWTFRLIREDDDGNPVPANLFAAAGRSLVFIADRIRGCSDGEPGPVCQAETLSLDERLTQTVPGSSVGP